MNPKLLKGLIWIGSAVCVFLIVLGFEVLFHAEMGILIMIPLFIGMSALAKHLCGKVDEKYGKDR